MTAQQECSERALALKRKAQAQAGMGIVLGGPPGGSWRDQETVTVEEAAQILRISRNSAYNAIHTGELPGIWVGKRFLVSVSQLKRMVDGEAA